MVVVSVNLKDGTLIQLLDVVHTAAVAKNAVASALAPFVALTVLIEADCKVAVPEQLSKQRALTSQIPAVNEMLVKLTDMLVVKLTAEPGGI